VKKHIIFSLSLLFSCSILLSEKKLSPERPLGFEMDTARFADEIFPDDSAFQVQPAVQEKIEGVVIDKSGKPIEKAMVMIISQRSSSLIFGLETNKEGKFSQIGLPPGYYQVDLRKTGYLPQSREVRVSVSKETKIEIALESGPESSEQGISEADKSFLRGLKLYGEKKYEEAAAAYEEAIKLGQIKWGYYLKLGLSYKKMGKKEEAKAAFQKAVELNPESYSAHKELGEVLADTDRFEEAKKYYEKAAEISPDDPDASFNLGICLLNTMEREAALRAFRKTIQLKPDYGEAYYHIGTLYISQNRVKEAVESLEQFLKLAPESENTATAKQLLEYLKKS
jgi:tetratricopeptide (TPR) repeat protein